MPAANTHRDLVSCAVGYTPHLPYLCVAVTFYGGPQGTVANLSWVGLN